MKRILTAIAAVTALALPMAARADVVLNFDDLPNGPIGVYHGVDFGTDFKATNNSGTGAPSSGTVNIKTVAGPSTVGEFNMILQTPSIFVGAQASGCNCASIQYLLYSAGQLVHTSDWFYFTADGQPNPYVSDYSPHFYASNYDGVVDRVAVYGRGSYWTLDDVTFRDASGGPSSATPEPAAWAMMLMGFGGLGAMLRRRRAALAVLG